MLKFRTKLLLVLMVASGLGIGILSGQHDGLYSAICIFALAVLVALTGASIIADLGEASPRKIENTQTEDTQQSVKRPHAA